MDVWSADTAGSISHRMNSFGSGVCLLRLNTRKESLRKEGLYHNGVSLIQSCQGMAIISEIIRTFKLVILSEKKLTLTKLLKTQFHFPSRPLVLFGKLGCSLGYDEDELSVTIWFPQKGSRWLHLSASHIGSHFNGKLELCDHSNLQTSTRVSYHKIAEVSIAVIN